jgi:serine protease Do
VTGTPILKRVVMRCAVGMTLIACLSAPTTALAAEAFEAGQGAAFGPGAERDSDPGPSIPAVSFGAGFFVTRDGHVLTSNHVVEGCLSAAVRDADGKYAPAIIVAQNKVSDLALLKARTGVAAPAAFRTLPPRVGESIVAFGYSIASLVGTGRGHATPGNILVPDGPGGDRNHVQISAALEAGNNGGPVLDMGANIIGVVNTKRAVVPAADNRDVSEQVAFAIKAIVAANFLERQNISYITSAPTPPLAAGDFVERAKAFTTVIQCRMGPSACETDGRKGAGSCNQSAKQSSPPNSSAN